MRPLERRVRSEDTRYHIRELGTDDNLSLLKLVNKCPIELTSRIPGFGKSILAIHRSPDYFAYVRSLLGTPMVLGVLQSGDVIASATVIQRQVSWDGLSIPANYVCDLKVHPNHRNTFVAARLMGEVRRRCGQEAATYVYVHEGSPVESGLLKGKAGLRQYQKRDRIHHLVFPTMIPSFVSSSYEVLDMTTSREAEWREYFVRNCHSRNLVTLPNERPAAGERRYGVIRSGNIVAVGSLVDQSRVRRMLVARLNSLHRFSRVGINSLAWMLRRQCVPAIGQEIRRAYLGNLIWKPGEPGALVALVTHCKRVLGREGILLLYLGLSARAGKLPSIRRRVPSYHFSSMLLTVSFPSETQLRPTLANLHEM